MHPKCKDKALSGERCPGVKTKYAKKGDDPSAEAHEAAHAGARKPKNAGNASSAVPYPEDESSDDEEEEAPARQPPRPLLSQPSLQRIGDGKKEEVATCIEDLYEIGEELGRFVSLLSTKEKEKKKPQRSSSSSSLSLLLTSLFLFCFLQWSFLRRQEVPPQGFW